MSDVDPLNGDISTGSPIEWLNSGVMYISKTLHLSPCNNVAQELLNQYHPVGTSLPLNCFLKSESEEYRLLADLVRAETELRDFVAAWETNGRVRHVLIDAFPKTEECGKVAGMYVVMKDLGNIVTLEQTMHRTDKLATVGKVAAGIAHEIRNPLTTIKGFLQMFERRFDERAMSSELEFTQVMLREIDRVNALVSELLLLAKPLEMQKRPCTIETIFTELNPTIHAQALQRNVQYTFVMRDNPSLVVDISMIKHVFMNLVKNALEAMENGGKLEIQVVSSGSALRIDISDTGPGIPYYQFDKIFDAFFTTKDKGTGLGLPICQRILDNHGGEIRVSSKGFGTTFSVLLPIEEHRPETRPVM